MAKDDEKKIFPAKPLEEIVSDAFSNLGYSTVENMIAVPSGSSIDLVLRGKDGKNIAVEVKAGAVSPSDVKQAAYGANLLGLHSTTIVSNEAFSPTTVAAADKTGVKLITTKELLYKIEENKIPKEEVENIEGQTGRRGGSLVSSVQQPGRNNRRHKEII